MPLLENLVQGLATAAGADDTAQAIQGQKDRRQGLSDEFRKSQITEHMSTANHMHKALALLLNPDTMQPLPGKEQQVAQLRQQLGQVDTRIKQLYDPNFNPQTGAVDESPLHKLGDKLHITQPPDNKTAGQQMQDLRAIQERYSQDPEQNPYVTKKRQLSEAGATPEEVQRNVFGDKPEKPEAENWVPANVKFADGTEATLQRNSKDGRWTDLAGNPVPPERLATATVAPKGSNAKPVRAWKKVGGKTTSVLLDPATNKVIPGSENPDILPPATMTGRVSTGYYHFVDSEGNVHQVQETRTSSPAGDSGASAPKTPKEGGTPKPSGDSIIGKKETPVQSTAHKTYISAFQLSDAADLAAKHPDNAQEQKSLGVALERAAAGRFTTAALDYINKAGWAAGAEQFWNNIDNGTLPTVVVKNLIERAHDNKIASYNAWQEALKGSGATPGKDDDDEFLKKIK